MGYALCDKHRGQLGCLCCDHVAGAAYGKSESVKFSILKLDIDGSKDAEILHHICDACVEKFELGASEYIPEEKWGSNEIFPYVYPVCEKCLSEHDNRT